MSAKSQENESFLPPLWILTLLILFSLFWVLAQIRELAILLLVGYSLSFAIAPILDLFEKLRVNRALGFLITFFIITIMGAIFFGIALPPFIDEIEKTISSIAGSGETIVAHLEKSVNFINHYLPDDHKIILSKSHVLGYLSLIDVDTMQRTAATLFGFLIQGYSAGLFVFNLILLPIIVFYISIDIHRFHHWAFELVPKIHRKKARIMFEDINKYLRAFIVGQTTVAIILAFLYSIGFLLAGHSQWFFLGIVTGLGNLVPLVGTVSGIVLSTFFSLTSDEPLSILIKSISVFIVCQTLEATVITPKIVGNKVGLSPALIILSILTGGKLFGILGIFLAVPGAAVLRVISGYAYRSLLHRAGRD